MSQCYDPIVIEHGRRRTVITPRAGKFKLEHYILFEDGSCENVSGGLESTETAARMRAESWTVDSRMR